MSKIRQIWTSIGVLFILKWSCDSARIPMSVSLKTISFEVFKNWTKYNDTIHLEHHYFPNGTHAIRRWENVTNHPKIPNLVPSVINNGTPNFSQFLPPVLKDLSPNIPGEPELNWNYAFTVIIVVGVLLIIIIIGGMAIALRFRAKKPRGNQINITNLLGNQEQNETRQKKAEKMQNI